MLLMFVSGRTTRFLFILLLADATLVAYWKCKQHIAYLFYLEVISYYYVGHTCFINMSTSESASFWDMLTSHTKLAGPVSSDDPVHSTQSSSTTSANKSKVIKEEERSFTTCRFITTCG